MGSVQKVEGLVAKEGDVDIITLISKQKSKRRDEPMDRMTNKGRGELLRYLD